MKKPLPLDGVKRPLQDRSRETFDGILDTAEELLAEGDFDALRIDELLATAGISTGSFYARFDGKDALLSALLERYARLLEDELVSGGPAADVPERLEARARAQVRFRIRRYRERVGLMRTVVLEYRHDTATSAEIRRLTRLVNGRIVAYFRPCRREIRHGDPEQAVLRGLYMVAAVCRDRILFGDAPHASSVRMPLSRLEDELTTVLVSYLSGGASGRPRSRS